MTKRTGFWLALGVLFTSTLAGAALASQSVSVSWSNQAYEFTSTPEGYLSIELDDSRSVHIADAGAPDLPWLAVRVPIAPGEKVVSWTFVPGASEVVAQSVTPERASRARPHSLGGPEAVPLDPRFYETTNVFPRDRVQLAGVQSRRGQAEATFLIAPFSWDPVSRELSFASGGQLQFEVEAGTREYLGPTLRLPEVGEETAGRSAPGSGTVLHQLVLESGGTEVPTLEGDPVQFILITAEELRASFQPIVDWKNRSGSPAILRTVDWIYDNYPQGVDRAESIRLFIRDAYLYWGTEAVVLAGDPEFVPVRYARDYSWNRPEGVPIVADQYFACLDGTWNANGNAIYGQAVVSGINEVGDQIDLRPEVRVGRISAKSVAEAEIYTHKYLAYAVNPIDDDYYRKAMVMGEVLFSSTWQTGDCDDCLNCPANTPCASRDGAEDCQAFRDSILASGAPFAVTELYERDYWWIELGSPQAINLSRDAALAAIDSGMNLIFHSGHGNQDRWSIGRDRLTASDLRGLKNAVDVTRYAGMVYAINCNSAAIDFDCSAEAFHFAPEGGGLIYIGASNLDFPHVATRMQDAMFEVWPGDGTITPGEAYYNATDETAAALGDRESADRFVLYSLIFLGDPDMPIWSDIPRELSVQFDASIELGTEAQFVSVSSGGSPVEGARVALYMEDKLLSVGLSDASGSVSVPFAPTETGAFLITVTAPNGRPFQDSGEVATGSSSFVALEDFTIDDTADSGAGIVGNGNGIIEAGETVAVNLTYQNRGANVATGLSATLTEPNPTDGIDVTILDGSVDLDDLTVGGAGSADHAFLIQIEDAVGADRNLDEVRLELDLTWTTGAAEFSETITPNIYRPRLVAFETTVVETSGNGDGVPSAGEVFNVNFEMLNMGSGTATGLQLRVQPFNSDRVTMDPADGILSLSEAAKSENATTETLELTFNQTSGIGMILFLEDTRTDPATRIWTRLFDIVDPLVPQGLTFSGERDRIVLEWIAPSDPELYAYRVYRSDELDGTYAPLGNGLMSVTSVVAEAAYYSDEGLPPVTSYFYKVAAIDSSGNRSGLTPPLAATTLAGFSPGWPVPLGGLDGIAPTIEQLDGWGNFEVVAGAEAIYAFRSDGGELHDGDHVPATLGRLSEPGSGYIFHAKPAVVDIDFPEDGEPEILTTSRFPEENENRRSELVCLDRRGQVRFKRTLSSTLNLSSPAVGDIDGDGDLEIVILGGSSCYAFHHDGTPVGDDGGRILTLPESSGFFLYSSVALADVIEDPGAAGPALEILFTARADLETRPTRFYCLRGDGSAVPGFPYRYDEDGSGSNASPAVADIDGDGYGEVFTASRRNLWMLDPNNKAGEILGWSASIGRAPTVELNPSPALGDLNRDEHLEVVIGGANGRLYAFDAETGAVYEPFTTSESEPYLQLTDPTTVMGSPIIGDLTGDQYPEVVIGDKLGNLFIYDYEGNSLPGYPYPVGGRVFSGLAMWDIDKNDDVELVIQPEGVLNILVLDFPGTQFNYANPDLDRYPWTQFRHDARNTGSIATEPITPLALQAPRMHAEGLSVTMEWTAEAGFVYFEVHRKRIGAENFEKLGSWRAEDVRVEGNDYRWVDEVTEGGTYVYQLVGVEPDGFQVRTLEQSIEVSANLVLFQLQRPQPNPFSTETSVQFALPVATEGTLRILDPTGRTVRTLRDGELAAGSHTLVWDGRDDAGRNLGGGVYFVHLRAFGQGERSIKLVRLR